MTRVQLTQITEAQYKDELEAILHEVEDAVLVFQTYEGINDCARESREVLKFLNRSPEFWNVQNLCFQTTLFITLGRLFDTDSRAHSLHRLVQLTTKHPEFFSAHSLSARKQILGISKEDADEYAAAAWVPRTGADLRYLKKGLAPIATRFNQVYKPIRHRFYAHREMSKSAAADLFAKTNVNEVATILDSSHKLVDEIFQLYINGLQPDLESLDYSRHNLTIRAEVRVLLTRFSSAP